MKCNRSLITMWIMTSFMLLFNKGFGHEIRPAYLEVKEIDTHIYEVKWKVPILNQRIPNINPIFGGGCDLTEHSKRNTVQSFSTMYEMKCTTDLGGSKIVIDNLERTLIDVVVRMERKSGEMHTFMIQPDKPFGIVPTQSSSLQVMSTFGILGIEHILFGWDHLLFVLGLLLLIRRRSLLLITITSFTLAHSITLALSSLGKVSLPSAPVETVIALSVIFLAHEYLSDQEESLTARYPWSIAFIFGLLHGFGFAGALSEIGLPRHALTASLFSFNVGVEVGQLLFVVAIYILYRALKFVTRPPILENVQKFSAYFIGCIASFWFIERLYGIVF